MERDDLQRLLREVRAGRTSVDAALQALRHGPVEAMEFAALDLHRAVRRGFPEAVYGPGKTTTQIAAIVDRIVHAGQTALVTRVDPDIHEAVLASHPGAEWHEDARAVVVRRAGRRPARGGIVVVSAGTSDIPVASEAILTAELMGNRVERIFDVGVAGLHRLLARRETLMAAKVLVVVAGMEGALPSVIAGLVDCPIIGVPASGGYGAGAGGQAALLAMLNSCAGGLTVVNIDNGYGAGVAAGLINRPASRKGQRKSS